MELVKGTGPGPNEAPLTVVPLGDRVLVRRVNFYDIDAQGIATDRRTGLAVPQEALVKRPEVEVLALGPGPFEDPSFPERVKKGDIVLLGEHSGIDYMDTLLVFEEEILAKLVRE